MSGVLASDGRFGVLLALLERASVYQGPPGAEVLVGTAADAADQSGWDHTIFAPTDEAFARLERATADCIFDGSTATDSVRLIVVPRILESEAFETGGVQTIGDSIPMRVADAGTSFGVARVIETDIHAANGVIHVIDEVIVPPQCTG